MKRIAVALIGAAILLNIAGYLYASAATVLTPASDVQDRIVTRGGVIRIGPSIYLHDNSTHASVGIRKLTTENCNLVIWTDVADETVEQVISANAEEDETMSRLQVQAGISGGGKKATVYLYRNGTRMCANDSRFGSVSNLWITLTYLRAS
jgi:hypothetical protein